MNLQQALEEAYEVGPATNLRHLAQRVVDKKDREKALKWAQKEIRDLLKRMNDGSGRTAHDKLNDQSALVTALNLYIEPETDDKLKKTLENSYQRVLQRVRANRR